MENARFFEYYDFLALKLGDNLKYDMGRSVHKAFYGVNQYQDFSLDLKRVLECGLQTF